MGREARDARKNARFDQQRANFHAMTGRFEDADDAPVHQQEARVANEHTMPFDQAKKYADKGIIEHMTTKGSGKGKQAVVVFKKNKKPPEIH
jgi:hypothetical protein